MRIAAGIIVWRDGSELIRRCLRSVAGAVDAIIIADGLIDGVETGAPTWTPLEWMLMPGTRIHFVERSTSRWQSQSVKRTALLGAARRLECDWLLQIDADERLENGHSLRSFLEAYDGDVFPIPFQFESDGPATLAAWKLLRVNAWRRIACQGGYIEHSNGNVYAAWSEQGRRPPDRFKERMPWISHHPDERDGDRARIRLGEQEQLLEPAPTNALPLALPGFAPPMLLQPNRDYRKGDDMTDETESAAFYCPQCGARYAGPGICENAHPPTDVAPIAPAPVDESDETPAASETTAATFPVADPSTSTSGVVPEPAAPTVAPATAAVAPSTDDAPNPDLHGLITRAAALVESAAALLDEAKAAAA